MANRSVTPNYLIRGKSNVAHLYIFQSDTTVGGRVSLHSTHPFDVPVAPKEILHHKLQQKAPLQRTCWRLRAILFADVFPHFS